MKKLLDLLRPLFKANHNNPYLVVVTATILGIVAFFYASQLKVDTDLANLLPEDYPSVVALNNLKEEVGGETSMEVAIKSPSFEANKRFAEALVDSSMKLYDDRTEDQFFERAVLKRDVEILKKNALYLATDSELDRLESFLEDEIEEAKQKANPFYFELDDEEEGNGGEGVKDFENSYNALVPSEYTTNADSTVLIVEFFPTGSKSDTKFLRDTFKAYDGMLSEMAIQNYHPEMEVQYGGRLKRHVEQLDSIMQDVFSSFATGISSVLLLVMTYFSIKKYLNYRKGEKEDQKHGFWHHVARYPVPLVIIGFPLILSLMYTFGITYFMFGSLNTMTSVLFVILFGMGIDYGLHFYARYIELRSDGQGVFESLDETYQNTAVAITTSALTTAAAMYVLIFADFRGFSEFGFISGTGIVLALVTMIFVLPALITIAERWNWILTNENSEEHKKKRRTFETHRFPLSKTIVVTSLLLVSAVVLNVDKLNFEYNFGVLEPEFSNYEAYKYFKGGNFNSTDLRNPAYILADSRDEVIHIVEELRDIKKQDTLSPTIEKIEALPERFPSAEEEIQHKLNRIGDIRELLKDPFIVDNKSDAIQKLKEASQTTEALPLDSLPDFIKKRFISKSGDIGNFVIVYPSVGLGDGRNSIAFKDDVGKITIDSGKTFYAASTSIVAADMLDLMIEESPYMISATFVIIFILMLFAFKSLRWTIIALLPLVVGLVVTFGIMMIFDIRLNFYNLVVLPAILGIGEDNGVHVASRYIEEGRQSMWKVLKSTGQHISVGSMTTMLGFMGLLFTTHPGLYSIGLLATIGIGMTLLTALILLPAIIQFLEDRDWIHFYD